MRMVQRSVYILSVCVLMLLFPPLSGVSAQSAQDTSFEIMVVGSEGSRVFLMQKRLEDLGFYTFRATGVYGAITRNSVVAFQNANDILVDGKVGEETYNLMFADSANRPYASSALSQEQGSKTQPSGSDAAKTSGLPLAWEQVNERMRIGQYYTITDYYTQTTFSVIRTGGNGHADVECVSNEDFAKFRSVFGGSVSWEKRAVVVNIGGTRVAASMFGMPHGYSTIPTNGMSGHVCIYFTGSTLAEHTITDVEHEAMIKIATGS